MKRFVSWRIFSVITAATVLFTALVSPAIAHADDDFTNAPDIDAGVRTDVGAGELVDENNGTITENSGSVNVNNGEIGTNTETGEVITNSGTGEIETNYGAIETNEGTVQTNAEGESSISTNLGTVEENNGSITTNGEDGTIPTNGEYTGTVEENNSYIGQNLETGVVTVNEGMIESNSGTVVTNKDPEDQENSAVAMPGTVCENTGIVENNEGTVNNNSGVVQENHGTVVNTENGVVEVNHQDGTVNGAGTVNMNLGTGTVANGVTVQKQMWSVGTQNWNQFVTNATNENSYSVRSGNKTELWFDSDAILFIRSGNGIRLTDITVDKAYRNNVNISKTQDGELLIWKISQLTGNVKLKLVVMSDAEEAEEEEENTDPAQNDEPENIPPIYSEPEKVETTSYFINEGNTDKTVSMYKIWATDDEGRPLYRDDGTQDYYLDFNLDEVWNLVEDLYINKKNNKNIDLYFDDGIDRITKSFFEITTRIYVPYILHFYIEGKHSILKYVNHDPKIINEALDKWPQGSMDIKSLANYLAKLGLNNVEYIEDINPPKEDQSETGTAGVNDQPETGIAGAYDQPGISGARVEGASGASVTGTEGVNEGIAGAYGQPGILGARQEGASETGTAGANDQPETGTAGVSNPTGETAAAGASGEATNGRNLDSSEFYNKIVAYGIVKKILARSENVPDGSDTPVVVKCGEIPQFSMDIITALFTNDSYNKEIHFEMNGLKYVLYIPRWTASKVLNDRRVLRKILNSNGDPNLFDTGAYGINLQFEK